MAKKPGAWDVVSTQPTQGQDDGGWNVVSTAPVKSAAAPPAAAPLKSGLGAFLDASGMTGLGHALRHPLDSAAEVLDAGRRVIAPNQPANLSDNPNPILAGVGHALDASKASLSQGLRDFKDSGLSQATRRDFVNAIPIVGPGLRQAQAYHDAGNDSAAVGELLGTATGLAAPKLLEAAPRLLSRAATATGEALETGGINRMDRFLNGGKPLAEGTGRVKLPAGARPGARVLQEGPSVSVTTSRPAQVQALQDLIPARGQQVADAVQQSSATVPWDRVRTVVDNTIAGKKSIANGPGGNPNIASRLDQLRTTFEPAIDSTGDATMQDLYAGRRAMDQNINWNRGPDPLDATVRNATRQIRGGVSNLMYDADPSLVEPNSRYADLSGALKLAEKHVGMAPPPLFSLKRAITGAATGTGISYVTHSPETGAAVGLLTDLLPGAWNKPIAQTGAATAAYQAGWGLQRVGQVDLPGTGVAPFVPLFPLAAQSATSADSLRDPHGGVGQPNSESKDPKQQDHNALSLLQPDALRTLLDGLYPRTQTQLKKN